VILPPAPRPPDPVDRLLRGLRTAPVTIPAGTAAVNACLVPPPPRPPKEVLDRLLPL
jgi:hypothetical protein